MRTYLAWISVCATACTSGIAVRGVDDDGADSVGSVGGSSGGEATFHPMGDTDDPTDDPSLDTGEPEPTDGHSTAPEPTDTDPSETDTTDADPSGPDPSGPDPSDTDPSDTDPTDTTDTDPTDTDPTDASTSGADPTDADPTDDGETGDPDPTGDPVCDEALSGYLWLPSGTNAIVSKLDVATLTEVGRYRTSAGFVAATAATVNRSGAVVLANGDSTATKIHGDLADCIDPNNTSLGADDVRAWQDGCVAWNVPTPYWGFQIAAWTHGELDVESCTRTNEKVWIGGSNGGVPEVSLLDGATGVVEGVVSMPDVPLTLGYGLFAGAVDAQGDLWASQLDVGHLVRVRLDDLSHEIWPMPHVGYGMTIDALGRPWTCNEYASRFDPETETWTSALVADYSGAGCMVDDGGTLWIAGNYIWGVDTETLAVTDAFLVPQKANPENRVLSVDGNGYVWSASHWMNEAYRWDPATGAHDTVTGLDYPIAWSDLTGFALAHAGG